MPGRRARRVSAVEQLSPDVGTELLEAHGHSACATPIRSLPEADIHIVSEPREALHQLEQRDLAELTVKYHRELRLRDAEHGCRLRLGHPAFREEFGNSADELRFDGHDPAIAIAEVGVNIGAAQSTYCMLAGASFHSGLLRRPLLSLLHLFGRISSHDSVGPEGKWGSLHLPRGAPVGFRQSSRSTAVMTPVLRDRAS